MWLYFSSSSSPPPLSITYCNYLHTLFFIAAIMYERDVANHLGSYIAESMKHHGAKHSAECHMQ